MPYNVLCEHQFWENKGILQGRVINTFGSCKPMQAPEICAFHGLENSELTTNNERV